VAAFRERRLSSSHPPLRSRSARRKLAVTLGLAALAAAVPFAGPGRLPATAPRDVPVPGHDLVRVRPAPAQLLEAAPGLSPAVLDLALRAARNARARGVEIRSDLLTVIDYTLRRRSHDCGIRPGAVPAAVPRPGGSRLEHGRTVFARLLQPPGESGDESRPLPDGRHLHRPERLLAAPARARGRDQRSGAGARDRDARRDYVSEEFARARGRSAGPGLPRGLRKLARPIIDAIKGGSLVFSYYGDPQWLSARVPAPVAGPVPGRSVTEIHSSGILRDGRAAA